MRNYVDCLFDRSVILVKLIQLEQQGHLITFSLKDVDYGYVKLTIDRVSVVDKSSNTNEMYLTMDNYKLLTEFFKEETK